MVSYIIVYKIYIYPLSAYHVSKDSCYLLVPHSPICLFCSTVIQLYHTYNIAFNQLVKCA